MSKHLLLLVFTHSVLAAGAFAWGWRAALGPAGAAAVVESSASAGPGRLASLGPTARVRADLNKGAVPETGPDAPEAFIAWAKAAQESFDPYGTAGCDQLRALFHQDPERALRIAMLAREGGQGGVLFAAFATEWAKTDFRGALEWAESLAPEAKEEAFTALVGGITAENASEVVESFLPALPPGYPRDRTLRTILARWSSTDAAACFAWVQTLPMPDIMGMITRRSQGDNSGFSELVEASPAAVADFVRNLPSNEHSLRLMQDTAEDLVAVDPSMALAWAASLESAGARVSCLTKVWRAWVFADLEAATAGALAQADPQARQWAIEAMASQAVANLDQAGARKWIDSLPAEARWAAEAEAMHLVTGPAAAERFTQLLAGSDATEHSLPKIARIAGYNFAHEKPEQAAEWAIGLPAGKTQIEAAAGVVSAWAKLDPVASSEWTASLPESEARDGAALGLAESLATSDPDIAFRWAESVASAVERDKALRATVGAWKKIDPISARRTVEASALTTGEKGALLSVLDKD